MAEFDIARIVPSIHDLHRAVSMGRRGLALICQLGPTDHAAQARRLDAISVRALALPAAGANMLAAATATASLPLLSLTPVSCVEDAQRARYFGADGVCIALAETSEQALADITASVRSMRMLPLMLVTGVEQLQRALATGARAIVWRCGEGAELAQQRVGRGTLLIAWPSAAPAELLRAVNGVVDAVVVPPEVHEAASFEGLLDELDG